MLGAGSFPQSTLLPILNQLEAVELIGIASASGLSARSAAERYSFAYCTSDWQALLHDPSINTVAIVTRHHLHARQVLAALVAGKHIFVEKPLCLNESELDAITIAYHAASQRATSLGAPPPLLMVGFNRRFAPFIQELQQQLQRVTEPLMLHYRVNGGFIAAEHWTQDPAQGGGRLLGEGCHFIDLLIWLAGSHVHRVTTYALAAGAQSGRSVGALQRNVPSDNLLVVLEFANGSLAHLTYVANGDRNLGKEYLEVSGGGLSARLDDYRRLQIHHGRTHIERQAWLRQDKGHRATWQALVRTLTQGEPVPMTFASVHQSTAVTLAAQRSLLSGAPVEAI
ncbi:MAG: Gfo/Idh/MocA family oxidoreductase [Chloroflexaceae bacterium]|nr:Gfo/Idh/MocA family oxidoreductase [Chloroflexaceae bacterium]